MPLEEMTMGPNNGPERCGKDVSSPLGWDGEIDYGAHEIKYEEGVGMMDAEGVVWDQKVLSWVLSNRRDNIMQHFPASDEAYCEWTENALEKNNKGLVLYDDKGEKEGHYLRGPRDRDLLGVDGTHPHSFSRGRAKILAKKRTIHVERQSKKKKLLKGDKATRSYTTDFHPPYVYRQTKAPLPGRPKTKKYKPRRNMGKLIATRKTRDMVTDLMIQGLNIAIDTGDVTAMKNLTRRTRRALRIDLFSKVNPELPLHSLPLTGHNNLEGELMHKFITFLLNAGFGISQQVDNRIPILEDNVPVGEICIVRKEKGRQEQKQGPYSIPRYNSHYGWNDHQKALKRHEKAEFIKKKRKMEKGEKAIMTVFLSKDRTDVMRIFNNAVQAIRLIKSSNICFRLVEFILDGKINIPSEFLDAHQELRIMWSSVAGKKKRGGKIARLINSSPRVTSFMLYAFNVWSAKDSNFKLEPLSELGIKPITKKTGGKGHTKRYMKNS